MSSKWPLRRAAPGRWRCPAIMRATRRTLPNMRGSPPAPRDLPAISTSTSMSGARPDGEFRTEELLAEVMTRLIGDARHLTDGGAEVFDCAGQGRLDVFFLSGGQIDGAANINLVSFGNYRKPKVRFSGSFGSAPLFFLLPRL